MKFSWRYQNIRRKANKWFSKTIWIIGTVTRNRENNSWNKWMVKWVAIYCLHAGPTSASKGSWPSNLNGCLNNGCLLEGLAMDVIKASRRWCRGTFGGKHLCREQRRRCPSSLVEEDLIDTFIYLVYDFQSDFFWFYFESFVLPHQLLHYNGSLRSKGSGNIDMVSPRVRGTWDRSDPSLLEWKYWKKER